MPSKKKDSFILNREMTKEEKRLLDMVNERLIKAGLHLRLMSARIDADGSISTEFVPPVNKWIDEDTEAVAIVQEELTKYLSR